MYRSVFVTGIDWKFCFTCRFPSFVKEEHLSAFRTKPKAKKGVLHPAFQNFISRALEWELVKDETMEESSSRLDFRVMDISVHGYILNSNAKEISNTSLGTAVPDFLGTPLLFLDLPEVSTILYSLFLRSPTH